LIESSTINTLDSRKKFVKVVDYTEEAYSNTTAYTRPVVNSEALKPKADKFSAKVDKSGISIGTKVNHKKWGQGTIVQLKDKNEDKEIVVAFDSVGLKKLLLSLAPIEIIK